MRPGRKPPFRRKDTGLLRLSRRAVHYAHSRVGSVFAPPDLTLTPLSEYFHQPHHSGGAEGAPRVLQTQLSPVAKSLLPTPCSMGSSIVNLAGRGAHSASCHLDLGQSKSANKHRRGQKQREITAAQTSRASTVPHQALPPPTYSQASDLSPQESQIRHAIRGHVYLVIHFCRQ